MPIPLRCECGRSMRVKDELAGKEGKCPSCGKVLVIPRPENERNAEDEALTYLLSDSPDDDKPSTGRGNRYASERESDHEPPRPRRAERDFRKEESRPRKEKRSSSGVAFEEGWFGSINSGVVGGLLMMLISVVWLVAGLVLIDRLFIYPAILFVIGIISLVKGLAGGE